ncbi:MAG: type II secretion system protein [Candidatus Omnitrophica bacterium]|nr:type II secretion system protein [Candidatus Omnitrophota bacterium]
MNKRTITLIELILAIVLLGVIILSATAIDVASRYFFKSSDTKVQVLNEVSFILEHIQKNASQATGWIDDPGFKLLSSTQLLIRQDANNPPTPGDFTDDTWIEYRRQGNNFRFSPDGGTNWETLSSRIVDNPDIDGDGFPEPVFSLSPSGTEVIVTLTARYDPSASLDSKTNPEVSLQTRLFLGEHSFN